MQRSSLRFRLPLPALIFFLVLFSSAVLSPGALARSSSEQQLQTKYFTIYYPQGEEETASWYASFADDVSAAVSEMLGQDPVTGLSLRIYTTEAEYVAANPAAASEPGIMAHAIPSEKEVGVAVERLRQVEPNVARESFRHEMTHIVAGALSNQNLPIGFQEALAQYNELSTSRAQDSMMALKNVEAGGVKLISWVDLNNRDVFMSKAALAYPESYSMMAFLAEKYGMGRFAQFMTGLRQGLEWQKAVESAYGKPVDALEAEWLNYLPGFLKDGWQQNLLTAYDLSPGVAFYEAGHFAEAKEHFARSQKLYSDLGRAERATAAADYLSKAERAEAAAAQAALARKSLEAYDYETSKITAQKAAQTFSDLNLKSQVEIAQETAQLAQDGLDATTMLASAQGHMQKFDLANARAEARFASQTFSKLGDTGRAGEANKIVSSLSFTFTVAGFAILGAGLLVFVGGGMMFLRSKRRGAPASNSIGPGEESASWL